MFSLLQTNFFLFRCQEHCFAPLIIHCWSNSHGYGIGDFLNPKNTNSQFKITNQSCNRQLVISTFSPLTFRVVITPVWQISFLADMFQSRMLYDRTRPHRNWLISWWSLPCSPSPPCSSSSSSSSCSSSYSSPPPWPSGLWWPGTRLQYL